MDLGKGTVEMRFGGLAVIGGGERAQGGEQHQNILYTCVKLSKQKLI